MTQRKLNRIKNILLTIASYTDSYKGIEDNFINFFGFYLNLTKSTFLIKFSINKIKFPKTLKIS